MANEQKNNFYKDNNNLFQYFNPSSKSQSIDQSAASTSNPNVAKKLNHNAKERDRRRQINTLFSSLRSLLPASDQMDNLNNPATVSVVLKYIPELKQQVEMLEKKKEELSSRISNRQGQADQIIMNNNNNINNYKQGGAAAISTNHVNGREIIIQISSYHKIFLSHILFELEEEYGLQLINATCLHSPQGIFFYTLHLKLVGRTHQRLECQILNNKLLSLFEQKAFS